MSGQILGAVGAVGGAVVSLAVAGDQNEGLIEAAKQTALDALDLMKQDYGNGISTQLAVANATGGSMAMMRYVDFHGHVNKYPAPPIVGPGQIGVFLHVHSSGAMVGSAGCMIYRTKDSDGGDHDVIFAWEIPYAGANKVFVAVTPINSWPSDDDIYNAMNNAAQQSAAATSSNAKATNLMAAGAIGMGTTARCTFSTGY